MIRVHARHFSGIGVEQSPLEVLHIGLKGGGSLVDVQIDFVGETARNAPLTKLPLCVYGPVKLVGIAGKSRVIAYRRRVVDDSTRSRSWNDGLQLPDLTILKRVGCSAKVVGKATGKGQFVEGVYPIGTQIVELPVGVCVALLQRVVGAHTFLDRHNIRLDIREMIGLTGKVSGIAVGGEDRTRDVVVVSHLQELLGVLRRDHSELS